MMFFLPLLAVRRCCGYRRPQALDGRFCAHACQKPQVPHHASWFSVFLSAHQARRRRWSPEEALHQASLELCVCLRRADLSTSAA